MGGDLCGVPMGWVSLGVSGGLSGGACPGAVAEVPRRAGSAGGWSARGCGVVFRNRSHVSCQCHHLTSFAVLMDISRREVGHGGTGLWRGVMGHTGHGVHRRCYVVGGAMR